MKERAVIDIRATVEAHSEVEGDLLASHGHSGADTVASFQGIGKATVVRVAKKRGSHSSAFVMCMLRINLLRPGPLSSCVLHIIYYMER